MAKTNKKKKKKAGGGKIGDAFKVAGDTLLSTVGLTDVIGDDAYKNQGFADASRVGEQLGLGAGKAVGSMFGLGTAVGMGQQALGAVDGQDAERARVEQIRANPEAYGKYAGSIGQMNSAIEPLAGGVGALGQIGAGFSGGNMFNKTKLPNGGTIPNVNVGEQIRPGSPRHLEIQELERQKQLYTSQQDKFSPLTEAYGEPTAIGADQFFKDNPWADRSILGEGVNTLYAYDRPAESDVGIKGGFTDAHQIYSDPVRQGRDYYTGYSDVDVPDYDLYDPYEDLDMSITPEEQYISADYSDPQLAQPQETIKQRPGSWYQNAQGSWVQAPRKAYGGKIDQMADGGKFIEYEGPSHAGGGINVDNNGVPTPNGNAAEVEGGETLHDNGIENYVFSDRIVVNPGDKKKITYADQSKKINDKYKDVDNDPIGKESRDMELESLKAEQEQFTSMMGEDMGEAYACGGKMHKMPGGGPLPQNQSTIADAYGLYNEPTDLGLLGPLGQAPIAEEYGLFPQQGVDNQPYVFGSEQPEAVSTRTGSELPQDKINPAGYFASNIGNLYDLTEAAQSTEANDFGRLDPSLINLDPQRQELRNQAATAQAVSRENARQGTAGSAMTNQVISNALINAGLGSQLSQSYMTEANKNAQIKNQAEQVNHQTRIQEKLADQQDLAKRKSTISQAMHSIGMNTQGYTKDLESARVGNVNNKMWFDLVKDGKYASYDYDEATGTFVMKLKDGRVITRQGDEITEVKPDSK